MFVGMLAVAWRRRQHEEGGFRCLAGDIVRHIVGKTCHSTVMVEKRDINWRKHISAANNCSPYTFGLLTVM